MSSKFLYSCILGILQGRLTQVSIKITTKIYIITSNFNLDMTILKELPQKKNNFNPYNEIITLLNLPFLKICYTCFQAPLAHTVINK